MNSILQEILELEKRYGHEEMFSGAADEDAALDKLALFLQYLSICETGDDPLFDSVSSSVNRMIMSKGLSPECAAFLLFLQYPEDDGKYSFVKKIYDDRSMVDGAVFSAEYYRRKYEWANDNYHMYDKYKIIMKKYISRYKDDVPAPFTGKGAIYTVITGGYDELNEPEFTGDGFDRFCFTDDPGMYSSGHWTIRKLETPADGNPVLMQRWAKTHPHILLPEYDFTIYIDGSFTITGDLREYINVYGRGSSMLCFAHPSRETLEEEVLAIKKRLGLDPDRENEFDEQVRCYRLEGYRDDEPLIESGLLVRSNRDERLKAAMEDWWKEISGKTHRDQLSIGYACKKNGIRYDISLPEICDNRYVSYNAHINEKEE